MPDEKANRLATILARERAEHEKTKATLRAAQGLAVELRKQLRVLSSEGRVTIPSALELRARMQAVLDKPGPIDTAALGALFDELFRVTRCP